MYSATQSSSVDAALPLDPKRFYEIVDLVRRRREDDKIEIALAESPDTARAWARYQDALDTVVRDMAARLRYFRPVDVLRKPFLRSLRYSSHTTYRQQQQALFTPELAIVLGEMAWVAALSSDQLAHERVARQQLGEDLVAMLGSARRLEALYPLLLVTSDILCRHRRPVLRDEDEGLALPFTLRVVEDFERIQALLAPAEDVIIKRNIPISSVPALAAKLSDRTMLRPELLADAFQHVYDETWHTLPQSKSARGAFVRGLRERAPIDAPIPLLVKLAGSSDGRNRAVAGISERTPIPVYDKLIRDNSLHVLMHVVANPHFDNNRAYAMIDQYDLPLQQVAVMLNSHARKPNGDIDIGIRALACERAINNERVDPLYIYEFLKQHHQHEEVPPYLWTAFVKEMHRRLAVVTAVGDEKQIHKFKARVERFTEVFRKDILQPYCEAAREIKKLERHPDSQRPFTYRGRALAQHRKFVETHEFVRDEGLLNILVEGTNKGKDLAELLRYCVEAELPVTRELMVKVFKHEDRQVREIGMQLLPHVSEEEVEKMAADLRARVAEDHAKVKERVLNVVIPLYEPIDAEPRLLSRMHHYFASDDLSEEETIRVYLEWAEIDPRKIPEAIEKAAKQKRLARQLEAMPAQPAADVSFETIHDLKKPAQQGDLFEEIMTEPAPPSKMHKKSRATSKALVRR